MTVDIICPLYNAEKNIKKLQKSFEKQKNVKINAIRYVLTKSNDNSEDTLKQIQRESENKSIKVIYKIIEKTEFSHSLTREKEAYESKADIIIFTTQDIIIEKENWLENLIKPIENNEADACYSRQLCNNNTIEKYTRESNYPPKSKIVSNGDIEELGLKTFFFSDASSAIKREIFSKLNGYDGKNFPTNEDMYFAYKLIKKGYKIKYCADSEVIHSHTFTLKQQYQRYYDTGKFFKMNSYLNKYKVNKAGNGLAKYIIKRAWQDKNWKVIFGFIPNMTARYIGMKRGKNSKEF